MHPTHTTADGFPRANRDREYVEFSEIDTMMSDHSC